MEDLPRLARNLSLFAIQVYPVSGRKAATFFLCSQRVSQRVRTQWENLFRGNFRRINLSRQTPGAFGDSCRWKCCDLLSLENTTTRFPRIDDSLFFPERTRESRGITANRSPSQRRYSSVDCQATRRLRAGDSPLKDLGAASIRPCSADRIGHVRAGTSRGPGAWTTEPESWELLRYRGGVICREASGLVVRRCRRDLNGSRRPQEGNTGVPYSTDVLGPLVSRTFTIANGN